MSKAKSKKTKKSEAVQAPKTSVFPVFFICMWVFSLGSAFGVVYSTFEARSATQTLESLRREATALKVTSGQYQLERSSLASYPRVEGIATKELSMRSPVSEETVLMMRE